MSFVLRSFRYRLRPTRVQEVALIAWLKATRELYNGALQERRDAWRLQRKSVGYVDQSAQLADIRRDRADLAAVPVVVLRGALRRIDRAFGAFFRRCKSGEKPGYPRFKNPDRWDSLLLDDLGKRDPIVAGGRRVVLPFVGKVRCYHEDRPVRGTPKALRILHDERGHWILTVACDDVPAKPIAPTDRQVGIDLGVARLATTSDGEIFRNPHAFDAARILTERAARRVSRRKKGSKRRRKAVRLLRLCHARTANVRREAHIKMARALVARYDTIFVEELNVKGLARGMLAKAINDVAWGGSLHWLTCKAEEAGKSVKGVPAPGTSLTCSRCGYVGPPLPLSVRTFRCAACGHVEDRDVNAAVNIKGLGLALRRDAALVEARQRPAKPSRRAIGAHRQSRRRPRILRQSPEPATLPAPRPRCQPPRATSLPSR